MRKLMVVLGILLLIPCMVYAAGTVTVKANRVAGDAIWLTYTWTADASDGSVPATVSGIGNFPADRGGWVCQVVTDPGSTAPTANYDITLTDGSGIDIMGGELADRSATATERAVPKIDTVFGCTPVRDEITMNLTNNSVNSATGIVNVIIFEFVD
jgi:hypothetical protein